MAVNIHPHARQRMEERGATYEEIVATVQQGEQFPAKFGRTGFRRNFEYNGIWLGKFYRSKQVEVYAVKEGTDWLAGWLAGYHYRHPLFLVTKGAEDA